MKEHSVVAPQKVNETSVSSLLNFKSYTFIPSFYKSDTFKVDLYQWNISSILNHWRLRTHNSISLYRLSKGYKHVFPPPLLILIIVKHAFLHRLYIPSKESSTYYSYICFPPAEYQHYPTFTSFAECYRTLGCVGG